MKQENAKTTKVLNNRGSNVTIDPELNKYEGQILFPKKLAIAEEHLRGLDLSEIKKQFKHAVSESNTEQTNKP